MMDAGMVQICSLINDAQPGDMPHMGLSPVTSLYFEERTVGYGRFYAAQGVNEQVDLLIRTWRCSLCRIGMYAVLSQSECDGQYRITNVQHLLSEDGLKCMDLTLERLETNYDIAEQT